MSNQRWIRSSCSQLKTRINSEGTTYQIYSNTTNQFDNFCLTLGELDDAIASVKFLIDFCKTDKGDTKTVEIGSDTLHITIEKMLGKKYIDMKLSGCAGTANITEGELKKIRKKLIKTAKY